MGSKIENERENDIQLGKLNRDDEENYDDREDAGLMADAAQRPQAPVPTTKGLNMATVADSKGLSILAYCLSSISMTVVNKYVVSGDDWNLTSLYLALQSGVCVITILICKQLGLIESLAPLEKERVKKCKSDQPPTRPNSIRFDAVQRASVLRRN
jgi:GDP-mannose transporter